MTRIHSTSNTYLTPHLHFSRPHFHPIPLCTGNETTRTKPREICDDHCFEEPNGCEMVVNIVLPAWPAKRAAGGTDEDDVGP